VLDGLGRELRPSQSSQSRTHGVFLGEYVPPTDAASPHVQQKGGLSADVDRTSTVC